MPPRQPFFEIKNDLSEVIPKLRDAVGWSHDIRVLGKAVFRKKQQGLSSRQVRLMIFKKPRESMRKCGLSACRPISSRMDKQMFLKASRQAHIKSSPISLSDQYSNEIEFHRCPPFCPSLCHRYTSLSTVGPG